MSATETLGIVVSEIPQIGKYKTHPPFIYAHLSHQSPHIPKPGLDMHIITYNNFTTPTAAAEASPSSGELGLVGIHVVTDNNIDPVLLAMNGPTPALTYLPCVPSPGPLSDCFLPAPHPQPSHTLYPQTSPTSPSTGEPGAGMHVTTRGNIGPVLFTLSNEPAPAPSYPSQAPSPQPLLDCHSPVQSPQHSCASSPQPLRTSSPQLPSRSVSPEASVPPGHNLLDSNNHTIPHDVYWSLALPQLALLMHRRPRARFHVNRRNSQQ